MKAVTPGHKRGIWICGPSQTGKTRLAEYLSKSIYDELPYDKSLNKWWDGY